MNYTTLIICYIISVIYSALSFYISYKQFLKWKSKPENIGTKLFLHAFNETLNNTESGKNLKKKILNPVTIFFASIVFLATAPVLFPLFLISHLKKIVKKKPEKQTEQISEIIVLPEDEK